MEPRSVDYPDYVKVYQVKSQEMFQQIISLEAKLLVATEYAGQLQEVLVKLQEENKTLQLQLNSKKPASKKAVATNFEEASGVWLNYGKRFQTKKI